MLIFHLVFCWTFGWGFVGFIFLLLFVFWGCVVEFYWDFVWNFVGLFLSDFFYFGGRGLGILCGERGWTVWGKFWRVLIAMIFNFIFLQLVNFRQLSSN